MENKVVLSEITHKLIALLDFSIKRKYPSSYRDDLTSINSLSNTLCNYPPSLSIFISFLQQVHNALVLGDTYLKCLIFRIIRLSLTSVDHCRALIDEEVHYILAASLDRESEFIKERTQSLKVMMKYLQISRETFPLGFARAIVASAVHKEDTMRKQCLECLRELCASNIHILAMSNGMSALLDAVLDPSTMSMQKSILLTVLHALSLPSSRKYLRSFLDIRTIISHLSDLDSYIDTTDSQNKRDAVKSALVIIMRSYTGLTLLCADELGFPILVKILKDINAPVALQEVILDALTEVCQPFISSMLKRPRPQQDSSSWLEPQASSEFVDIVPFSGGSVSIDESRSSSVEQLRGTSKDGKSVSGIFSSFFTNSKSPSSRNKRTSQPAPAKVVTNSVDSSAKNKSRKLDSSIVSSSEESNPVYNLVDNYIAFLCCAFLHTKLLEGLNFLSIHSHGKLSLKSRNLLLGIFRSMANIFPERICLSLMTVPCLIYSSSGSSTFRNPNQAFKASQILYELANIFPLSLQFSPTAALTLSMCQNSSQIDESCRFKTSNVLSKASSSIFDVVEEIRKSSQSRIATLVGIYSKPSLMTDITLDIKSLLILPAEKNEFAKQMELSKILGKDGKEPLKWDWGMINDMLEFSFHHHDRVSDSLKTKWIRRLSGFFRCSLDEKGYFAHMDWDPSNLSYLECACNLYHILVEDNEGVEFLNSDRRGVIFNDMSKEFELLAEGAKGSAVLPTKNVFRHFSCLHTMTREYFTLVGRLTTTNGGRVLLEKTRIFSNMTRLGSYSSLDYVSRIVVSTLAFTDRGYLSKHLCQLWSSDVSTSPSLKYYLAMLLMAVLQCRPADFYTWGLDVLVGYIANSDTAQPVLFEILELACQDKTLLKTLLSKGIKLADEPLAEPALLRFACLSEGLAYLKNIKYLDKALDQWKATECSNYVKRINHSLMQAMIPKDIRDQSVPECEPISFKVSSMIPFSLTRPLSFRLKANMDPEITNLISNVSLGITHIISPYVAQSFVSNNAEFNASSVNLEGFYRAPWNIDVKLNSQGNTNSTSGAPSDYLHVDTFFDSSSLKHPTLTSWSCDRNRTVTIRGIILNNRGLPQGFPIPTNKILASTLMIGTCPVDREGNVQSLGDLRSTRRFSFSSNSAASRDAIPPSKRGSGTTTNPGTTSPTEASEIDIPISYHMENYFDWSNCSSTHRQTNAKELENGLFSVQIPGEPVTWIFSRSASMSATGSASGRQRSETIPSDAPSSRSQRTGNAVYLVEVQYKLNLLTGQSLFVPMPRHFYGELAQTSEGCDLLSQRKIISEMLTKCNDESLDSSDRAAAFWALGHIGCSDYGINRILSLDSSFVDMLLQRIVSDANYNIRSTCFHVAGLISRSKVGNRKFIENHWESSNLSGISAVVMPLDPSILFSHRDNMELDSEDCDVPLSQYPELRNLSSCVQGKPSRYEDDVLSLIAKLPGVVAMFKEAKMSIEKIRSEHPEVFRSRELYIAVHKLFECYSFRLMVRREIFKLFDPSAKIKGNRVDI